MSVAAIVLVTTSFPIANDGSEAAGSFVSDLAEELARHVPVRVVAPGLSSVRESWVPNVELFRYKAPAKPLSTLKPWCPTDVVEIARVLRAGIGATRDAVMAGPTEHIFALWALPSGEWARRVAHKHGIGYSVWMLGSDVWSLGRVPVLRSMLARVMREAVYAYADGYQLAKDARRIAGIPVAFLPSARRVDLRDPPPPRAQPPYRLLFLGRWHPNKGVDLLLDALALLGNDDWCRIECVEIQGGGPLEALIRERVATLRAVGRQVELGDFLVKREAEKAIARADWVLIPSRIESIPVVFSDAMKLGRPVVANPVGDLPRLFACMVCGELAEGVSAVMFSRAIQKALRTSPRAYDMAVRHQASHFDLAAIATSVRHKVLGDG
ncbi:MULTISPECIES: glycosyltransferase [unclassified Rhodanobacter]|uniref:glycosyltransferase n=1 Tax=unclassified Rhodanobacter TaxID=2621553 RepID=UPI000AF6D9A8|nr:MULTISPECIES: glycosyltransferase [unclassified Rhodanobacter]